jgi:CubicO group peptidase (beta-lactamase class C family)
MMNRRNVLWTAMAAAIASSKAVVATATSASQSVDVISDAAIRQLLIDRIDRIDRDQQSVGMVVGVVTPHRHSIVSYGLRAHPKLATTPETVFNLGSVTKVFTSLLLADTVRRGEVALDDPATKFLPPGLKALQRNGRSITLADLATHTSGLPSSIIAVPSANGAPATKLTVEQAYSSNPDDLYRFLAAYELTQDPGSQYIYSHLGMNLLAHILAVRANSSFAALLEQRILRPLRMKSTGGSQAKLNSSTGHDADLNPLPAEQGFGGAGGLQSSARDMVVFLEAAMGLHRTELTSAFATLLSVQRSTLEPNLKAALGWMVRTVDGRSFVEKGGTSIGFHSYVGYDPTRHVGVVVLSNSVNDIEDVGRHLLDATYPLTKIRRAIAVDPSRLDSYVGRYKLPPSTSVEITRDGDTLLASIDNSPKLKLYREADETFFLKQLDFIVAFQREAGGRVGSFQFLNDYLREKGIKVIAPRVE